MSLKSEWVFKVDSLDKGIEEAWFRAGTDRSSWTSVRVPDYWDRYNLEEYDGVGGMQRRLMSKIHQDSRFSSLPE